MFHFSTSPILCSTTTLEITRQLSQWRSAAYHPRQQWGAASAHRRCLYDVLMFVHTLLPRSCNQQGLGRSCWVARGPDGWSQQVFPAAAAGWCHGRDEPAHCPAGMNGESDSEHVCVHRVDSSNTLYDLLLDWKNSSVTNMLFKCVYLQEFMAELANFHVVDFQGSGAAQNRWGGKMKHRFNSLSSQ